MLTTRIEGVRPLGDDRELVEALGAVCCTRAEKLTGLRRVALLGPDGRAYRLILAQDDAELDTVVECLKRKRFKSVTPYAAMDAVLRR